MSATPQITPRIRFNLWMLRLSRNWIRIALLVIGLYASLPVVAPVLMNLGATGPARVLYTLYSPFCHQFAFRSFFIGGEQPVYPRAAAETDWIPYDTYIAGLPEFNQLDPGVFTPQLQLSSRAFVGNEQMGYKTALCQRDIFIYTGLFVGGAVYARFRRRIRPVPFWIYVIVGLGPIGIDGFSQLLGYPPFNLWEVRETIPAYRVVTGAIFGVMTAWLGFPHMDRSMDDTIMQIRRKLAGWGVYK